MRLLSYLTILACLLTANVSSAWVDLKNANFALTRKDFEVEEAGPDLLLERNYNSRVENSGMFGRGWCTNVESSVTVVAKGLAVYRYCGTGRARIFKSSSYSASEDEVALKALVKTVGEKMNREARIPNGFEGMLKADVEIRATLARNYGAQAPVVEGERFTISNFPEASELTFTKGRFALREEDGDVYEFDSSGAITKVADRKGQTVSYEWAKGLPKAIVDSRKNRIALTTDSAGRITEARGPGRQVKYRYSNDGDLVAVDAGKLVEKYEYDADHNLTSFKWGNATLDMKYDSKTDRVVEVMDPNCTKKYRYDVKSSEKRMSVELESKCKDKERELVKYEFKYESSKSGQIYQAEMIATDAKKNRTSVRYAADNRPARVERRGVVTEFVYDEDGRLSKVKSDDGIADYRYDEKGRISIFNSNVLKGPSPKKREIRYSYSADGSLASTSEGGVVTTFAYDRQGRLSSVSNTKGKRVDVSHRSPASELPSGLKSSKDGKIDLTYGTSGVVVPPRNEEELARFVSVMNTYQELLEPGSEVLRRVTEP